MNKVTGITLAMGMLAVVSCGTNQGTGALIGAGGGAIVGGIIGKLAGNTAVGAAIGGAVGAGTGAIIGRHMDKVAEQAKQIENAKVEKVQDANGLEAVPLIEKHHPDIIITDLKMPEMDGLELIRFLKEKEYPGEILVLSNYEDFDSVRSALLLGAADYLLKIKIQPD
uniref:response regulator n=1 Tax=Prevotella sp. TaxID=59823 RepID=UPI0027E2C80B